MSADSGGGDQARPYLTGIKETLETISVSEDYIDMPLDIATRGQEAQNSRSTANSAKK